MSAGSPGRAVRWRAGYVGITTSQKVAPCGALPAWGQKQLSIMSRTVLWSHVSYLTGIGLAMCSRGEPTEGDEWRMCAVNRHAQFDPMTGAIGVQFLTPPSRAQISCHAIRGGGSTGDVDGGDDWPDVRDFFRQGQDDQGDLPEIWVVAQHGPQVVRSQRRPSSL